MRKLVIYLAHPYSHEDPETERLRFESANWYAAQLMEAGFIVLSPISHSHPINKYLPDSMDTPDHWLEQDKPLYKASDVVVFCMEPGIKESFGCKVEKYWCDEDDKWNIYIDRDNLSESIEALLDYQKKIQVTFGE